MSQIHALYSPYDKGGSVDRVVPFSGCGHRLIDGKEIVQQTTNTIDISKTHRSQEIESLEHKIEQIYSQIQEICQQLKNYRNIEKARPPDPAKPMETTVIRNAEVTTDMIRKLRIQALMRSDAVQRRLEETR